MNCPDCHGTGKYTGFTKVEPCARCGGSGNVGAVVAETLPQELAAACGMTRTFVVTGLDDQAFIGGPKVLHWERGTHTIILNEGAWVLDRDFDGTIEVRGNSRLDFANAPRVSNLVVERTASIGPGVSHITDYCGV